MRLRNRCSGRGSAHFAGSSRSAAALEWFAILPGPCGDGGAGVAAGNDLPAAHCCFCPFCPEVVGSSSGRTLSVGPQSSSTLILRPLRVTNPRISMALAKPCCSCVRCRRDCGTDSPGLRSRQRSPRRGIAEPPAARFVQARYGVPPPSCSSRLSAGSWPHGCSCRCSLRRSEQAFRTGRRGSPGPQ